jgi:trimethylamine--corrinoid protein Co-methyltransferase
MRASLPGASFAGVVLDSEMLSTVCRVLRGGEVSQETPGFEAICEAVLGEGHFLGSVQTHAAMERDHVYPKLADLDRRILAVHHPAPLDPAQEAKIRATFPILS